MVLGSFLLPAVCSASPTALLVTLFVLPPTAPFLLYDIFPCMVFDAHLFLFVAFFLYTCAYLYFIARFRLVQFPLVQLCLFALYVPRLARQLRFSRFRDSRSNS